MCRSSWLFALMCVAPLASAADGAVHWPVPYRAGYAANYTATETREEQQGGQRVLQRFTSETRERAESATPDAVTVSTTQYAPRVEIIEGDRRTAEAAAPMAALMDGATSRATFGADGRLRDVSIDADLNARLHAVGKTVFDALVRLRIEALPADERATVDFARLDEYVDKLVEQNYSSAALHGLARDANLGSAMMGRTYEPGESYDAAYATYDVTCGEVPATLSFWLDPGRTDARTATVKFRRVAQPVGEVTNCSAKDFRKVEGRRRHIRPHDRDRRILRDADDDDAGRDRHAHRLSVDADARKRRCRHGVKQWS